MNAKIVYKKSNKWFTGTIKEDKLRKTKQINKLSDVTETQEYLTLKQWMKKTKTKGEAEEFLTKFKIQSLYIKDVPIVFEKTENGTDTHPTAKQFWAKLNEICIKCKKNCKQSSYAFIMSCNGKA